MGCWVRCGVVQAILGDWRMPCTKQFGDGLLIATPRDLQMALKASSNGMEVLPGGGGAACLSLRQHTAQAEPSCFSPRAGSQQVTNEPVIHQVYACNVSRSFTVRVQDSKPRYIEAAKSHGKLVGLQGLAGFGTMVKEMRSKQLPSFQLFGDDSCEAFDLLQRWAVWIWR